MRARKQTREETEQSVIVAVALRDLEARLKQQALCLRSKLSTHGSGSSPELDPAIAAQAQQLDADAAACADAHLLLSLRKAN